MARVKVGENVSLFKAARLRNKDSNWEDILPKISLREQHDKANVLYKVPSARRCIVVACLQMRIQV